MNTGEEWLGSWVFVHIEYVVDEEETIKNRWPILGRNLAASATAALLDSIYSQHRPAVKNKAIRRTTTGAQIRPTMTASRTRAVGCSSLLDLSPQLFRFNRKQATNMMCLGLQSSSSSSSTAEPPGMRFRSEAHYFAIRAKDVAAGFLGLTAGCAKIYRIFSNLD